MQDRRPTRWQYRDPGLLWLFPIFYVLHLLEECCAGGGFPLWAARHAGGSLTGNAFLALNALGLAAATAGVWLVLRRERFAWVPVALAVAFLTNTLLHVAGTFVFRAYSPGLITSIVLWVPLTQLTLLHAWHQASGRTFWSGALTGSAPSIVSTWIALR